jgi:hypothetical protein
MRVSAAGSVKGQLSFAVSAHTRLCTVHTNIEPVYWDWWWGRCTYVMTVHKLSMFLVWNKLLPLRVHSWRVLAVQLEDTRAGWWVNTVVKGTCIRVNTASSQALACASFREGRFLMHELCAWWGHKASLLPVHTFPFQNSFHKVLYWRGWSNLICIHTCLWCNSHVRTKINWEWQKETRREKMKKWKEGWNQEERKLKKWRKDWRNR